jgi:hypothetical protein
MEFLPALSKTSDNSGYCHLRRSMYSSDDGTAKIDDALSIAPSDQTRSLLLSHGPGIPI